MYPGSKESFELVKEILLKSIPFDISVKKQQQDNVLIVMTSEMALVFLNDVALNFLSLCNGKKTVNDIISSLLEIYDTDFQTLSDDIVMLIRDLQTKRIIYVEC